MSEANTTPNSENPLQANTAFSNWREMLLANARTQVGELKQSIEYRDTIIKQANQEIAKVYGELAELRSLLKRYL